MSPKGVQEMGMLARAAALCMLLVLGPLHAQPGGTLEVRFISVGQADAALVRCPDRRTYLLIDSADDRYPGSTDAFRKYLGKELDGRSDNPRIALAVASHPHADHIASMQWVLETYGAGTYV